MSGCRGAPWSMQAMAIGLWGRGAVGDAAQNSLGPDPEVLGWHGGASGLCLAGLFLITAACGHSWGEGTAESWHCLAPHTYAQIRLVLRPSEPARAICTLHLILFVVGVGEGIGTGLWNNTTAGEWIKMEPELLKTCHSIARGLQRRPLQGPDWYRKMGSQPRRQHNSSNLLVADGTLAP